MRERFDAIAEAMARARTRRAMVMALISATTIGALRHGTPTHAGAGRQASSCRGARATCRKGKHCCSGRCRKRRGKGTNKRRKKGKCRCSPYLGPCVRDSDCCPYEAPLVCASGSCQT